MEAVFFFTFWFKGPNEVASFPGSPNLLNRNEATNEAPFLRFSELFSS